ncbi:MAG: MATE family efflux transporter [Kiritimatiellia bacterium]
MPFPIRERLRILWHNPGGVREVLPVALPLIISSGANAIMMFCDRVFLARFDSISIQAALPAGVLSFTLCCGFQAVIAYTGTFVAQYYGAKRLDQIVRTVFQGFWLTLTAIPLMMLLIPAGIWLIRSNGHPVDVVASEELYFSVLMVGGVFLCVNALLSGYFCGVGKARLTMYVNLVGAGFNIGADWLLIFGNWGLPRMGIFGAGLATVLGVTIPGMILFLCFLRELARGPRPKGFWRPDLALCRRICRFGLPAAGHQLIEVSAFTAFVMLLGRLGALELAAGNICFSINHLAFAPLYGLGVAASILVGRYQGARESGLAERAGWSSVVVGLGYMGVVGGSFLLVPDWYLSLFGANQAEYSIGELLGTGMPLLRLMAFWGFADLVNIVLVGALRGAGDTRVPLLVTTLGSWLVWLPVAGWMVWRQCSILAQWQYLAGYCWVLAGVFLWRWLRGRWKSIRVIHTPGDLALMEPPGAV